MLGLAAARAQVARVPLAAAAAAHLLDLHVDHGNRFAGAAAAHAAIASLARCDQAIAE